MHTHKLRPGSNVGKPLPENFTPEMVSGDVKETCLNWFYKIASIRELLPRLYLEIALIKSMSFLSQNEFNQTLLRLCHMIRGIGDPLIAAYVRCYLCRVGPTVTKDTKYLEENLNDFLFVYHTVMKSNHILTIRIITIYSMSIFNFRFCSVGCVPIWRINASHWAII